ncbi:hypothetical protein BHE97_05075 [Aeromicrobium sp. PE09-221]|uniref:TetR/AcrR family transcriptional regulator n=1 Tax=Aeromicrobium sp. PE09-221 TaxID=1898043 RepID=UPI000B3EDD34|nr:TetR/AcrR family transcriptional regulator [Aeromicrobium sp. PE09-221]OUZ11218.1 hypothetical protein BHE97_05075 [Aeromicrobium sp. PE09-221]
MDSETVSRGRGESARQVLLDELIDLYLAEGFLRFGTAELAARLRCSKSTLYAIAGSKERIIVTAVRAFFRRATEGVEDAIAGHEESPQAVSRYLEAIATQLRPASARFFADLDAFEPAGEIYQQNTRYAARRVQQLVRGIDDAPGPLTSAFAGAVAGQLMDAIHRGEIEALTGLDDASAYHQLAALLTAGAKEGRPR